LYAHMNNKRKIKNIKKQKNKNKQKKEWNTYAMKHI
jgi:hypothetical protein